MNNSQVLGIVIDRQCNMNCVHDVLRRLLSEQDAAQTDIHVPDFCNDIVPKNKSCTTHNSMRSVVSACLSSFTKEQVKTRVLFFASSTCTQALLQRMHELAEECRRKLGVASVHMYTRCSRTRDSIMRAPIHKASLGTPYGGVMRFVDPRPGMVMTETQQRQDSALVCEQRVMRGALPVRCFTCKAVMTPEPRPGGEKICCFQLRMVHINTMDMDDSVSDARQKVLGDPAMRIRGAGGGVNPTSVAAARIFRQLQRQNAAIRGTQPV